MSKGKKLTLLSINKLCEAIGSSDDMCLRAFTFDLKPLLDLHFNNIIFKSVKILFFYKTCWFYET